MALMGFYALYRGLVLRDSAGSVEAPDPSAAAAGTAAAARAAAAAVGAAALGAGRPRSGRPTGRRCGTPGSLASGPGWSGSRR